VRRSQKIGGGGSGAALAANKIFFNDSRKNFVISSKFSDNLTLVIENCDKISTQQQWHRRQIIGRLRTIEWSTLLRAE